MEFNSFIQKIKDSRLSGIVDSISLGNAAQFEVIQKQFPEYDPAFLRLLSYSKEGAIVNREYIAKTYEKFRKVLDSNFPKTFASKGNFGARMWELVLCDVLSMSGELKPKGAAGADFILESFNKQQLQIEAVVPEESGNKHMRAIRPDYIGGHLLEFGGKIHDLERPIVLRTLQAFNDKKLSYRKDLPLIIAINSYKAVGLTSDDSYVLRRLFFGLGNLTLTKLKNGGYRKGFEQLPYFNKPGQKAFPIAFFRKAEFKYISGVIYSSQDPLSLAPGEHNSGWYNSGITFMHNPEAYNPVKAELPFFKQIICNEKEYLEIDAKRKFTTSSLADA